MVETKSAALPSGPRSSPWGSRIIIGSLLCAALGLLVLAAGGSVDPRGAWFAYLDAWLFGVGLCQGALLLLMVGHAAKADWMVVTRRCTEAVVAALPLYLVLFVPIASALRWLYPWAAPLAGSTDDPDALAAATHRSAYLSPAFFVARAGVYFAVFVAVGTLLCRWSRVNDATPRAALVLRMRKLSAGAFPAVGLALTWASFDWAMSLSPAWSSTIYGLYCFSGSFVGAIALVCVMLCVARSQTAVRLAVTGDHAQALGRLLFAMTIFWAYMAFSQLLIYWLADLPEEVSFYTARVAGSWSVVTYGLVLGHFVVPFFALLNRRLKRHLGYLGAVGAWMLAMHLVDVWWLVMPARDVAGVRVDWFDLGAFLFVGGVSSAWIGVRYRRGLPLPRHVPELAAGLDYRASV